MNGYRNVRRWTGLVVCGGFLFQLLGCAATIAPVLLSFGESTALSFLLQGIVSP